MKSSMIFARDLNGVIGANNGIPWYSPDDLQLFKELTMGKVVIMGRKTWDSLPIKVRPLPGRFNIVITSDVSNVVGEPQAVVNTIEAAVEIAEAIATKAGYVELVFIGGSSIYNQVVNLVDEVHVSEFNHTSSFLPGDQVIYFPHDFGSDPNKWRLNCSTEYNKHIPYFTYQHYVRKPV